MSKGSVSVRLQNWMVNEGPYVIWFCVWWLIQLTIFGTFFHYFYTTPDFKTFRSYVGAGLPVARGAAYVINVSSALILLAICRNLISYVRPTFLNKIFPFDHHIHFHRMFGWSIVFWASVHTIGHFFNVLNFSKRTELGSPEAILWSNPTTLSGAVLVVIMMLMATSARSPIRRKHFEQFWYTHHLYIAYFAMMFIHGSFCFIKSDIPPYCGLAPAFWKYFAFSGVVFLVERLLREYRGRQPTYISKVIQHPSKVIEIQIKKPSCKMHPGQYIYLNCPEISLFQWHPFTLTSSPEEDFVSVHMRIVGDWTGSMAKILGCEWDKKGRPVSSDIKMLGDHAKVSLPRIMLDGPYGAASEDVFNFDVSVCVGAGIGVTPFGSVLKHIWYKVMNSRKQVSLKKVYFIWVCRDTEAFEWFRDVLVALEEEESLKSFIDIHIYLTAKLKENEVKNLLINNAGSKKDAITGLMAPTRFGRPNLDKLFTELQEKHQGTDVGVFYCGPKILAKNLYNACNKYTTTESTKFYFHKENF